MRILIAEDDQVLADGLLRAPARGRATPWTRVTTGTEADAAVASHEFDLLILDLGPAEDAAGWRCSSGCARAARACRC
jgi:two-component system OmpR family response regulator